MNKKKIALKTFYFLLFACVGIYSPYIGIYLKNNNFSGSRIGLLMTIATVFSFFSQIFWGHISDKYSARNKVICFCIIGNMIFSLLFMFPYNYYWILFVMIMFSSFFKPLIPLADSSAFEHIAINKSELIKGNDITYGKLRVWGTIGFLFSSAILSSLLEKYSLKLIFPILAIMIGLSLGLPNLFIEKLRIEKFKKISGNFAENLKVILKNKTVVILLLTGLLVEISCTVIYGFLGIYFNSLNIDNYQVGLLWSIGVIVEIPFIFYSGNIAKKIGLKSVIFIGISANLLRFLAFYFMPQNTPILIIYLIQISHGIFFGLYYAGALSLLDSLTEPELRTSVQSVFSALTFNLGSIIGFSLNGYILENFGMNRVFLFNSILLIAGIILTLSLNPDNALEIR